MSIVKCLIVDSFTGLADILFYQSWPKVHLRIAYTIHMDSQMNRVIPKYMYLIKTLFAGGGGGGGGGWG